jgi:hypothetical protein
LCFGAAGLVAEAGAAPNPTVDFSPPFSVGTAVVAAGGVTEAAGVPALLAVSGELPSARDNRRFSGTFAAARGVALSSPGRRCCDIWSRWVVGVSEGEGGRSR